MTHIKTVAGLTSTLKSTGVVLLSKGGATSAAIGDSLASPKDQVVFHVHMTNAPMSVTFGRTFPVIGARKQG